MLFVYVAALLFAASDIDAKPFPQYSSVSTKLDQHVIKRQLPEMKVSGEYADESSPPQNLAENKPLLAKSDSDLSTVSDIDDTSSDPQDSPIIASLENSPADSWTIDDLGPSSTESQNPSMDDCNSRDGHIRKRDPRQPEACPLEQFPPLIQSPLPWARPERKPHNNDQPITETKVNPCPGKRAMMASRVKVPEKSKHVSCGGPVVGKTALYPVHVLNCVPGKPGWTVRLLK